MRRTQPKLGEKLRRAAGCVKAENGRGINLVVRRGRNGHEWVQVWNVRNLRRLAYGLEQELADFAIVRVVCTAARSYELSRNRMVLVIVVMMMAARTAIAVVGRGTRDNLQPVVMVAVVRREQVQTLAQHRYADISRQQRAGQEFANGRAHDGEGCAAGR